MKRACFYPSLTRISPLAEVDWAAEELPRSAWGMGDYVLCEAEPAGFDTLELPTGRMLSLGKGDHFVGVLGDRDATLEATGSWREAGDDLKLDVLTSAGLVGKLTSKAPLLPQPMAGHYRGHVMVDGSKATMQRFVPPVDALPFRTPVVLLVATSMSAGKTTVARVVIKRLKKAGLSVLGAKIAGAGRYRDILGMADAGADWVYDFVDSGLPSTVLPGADYRHALDKLLSMMARHDADVAIVEIGASPLEAYNGTLAIEALRDVTRCTALAATDPYAAAGLLQAYDLHPDFVCGPAVNTTAGEALVETLCAVPPLNVLSEDAIAELDRILHHALGIDVHARG